MTTASGADTINPGSDWAAVAAAVRKRMTALQITTAGLAQNTGLSEATIRSIRARTASPRSGTLARLSKGLGWPGGYLADVAAGKAYLPTHGLVIGDVVARIDARLARVESQLDKLIRGLDDRSGTNIGRGAYGDDPGSLSRFEPTSTEQMVIDVARQARSRCDD